MDIEIIEIDLGKTRNQTFNEQKIKQVNKHRLR